MRSSARRTSDRHSHRQRSGPPRRGCLARRSVPSPPLRLLPQLLWTERSAVSPWPCVHLAGAVVGDPVGRLVTALSPLGTDGSERRITAASWPAALPEGTGRASGPGGDEP